MSPILIAGLVAVGVWLLVVAVMAVVGRTTRAIRYRRLLPDLVRLIRALIRDPRVPRGSKILLIAGAAWIISPIDLIPEFIPLLGPLDDLVIVALLLRHLVRAAGPEVLADNWGGDAASLALVLRFAGGRTGEMAP